MKNLKSTSIFSIFLLAIACSRIEFATSWANTYIAHRLDGYFDTNGLQSQLLKKSLTEDIKKVRKIIFPQLAKELKQIENEIVNLPRFSLERAISHKVKLRNIFNTGLAIFEKSAQDFVDQLDTSQVNSFKEEFDKKTNELRAEIDRPLAARESRFDKIKNQLEGWIGTLYFEQKKDIQDFSTANLFPIEEQVLNRNILSKEFIESFSDKEKRKKFIHQLFYNYESLREPSYKNALDEDQRKYLELIVAVLNKMNADQKKHLLETLKDRADQIKEASEFNED